MRPLRVEILISSLLGLALLALTACSDQTPTSAAAAPAASPAPTASVTTPPNDNSFSASGPLIVEHQLDLLSQREGLIAKLHADVGARVGTGQILAELDNRQLTADLEAARSKTSGTEAELKSWQSESRVLDADFDRATKLWNAQLIPLEQYEHAKYKAEEEKFEVQRVEQALASAKASQESLELELEKTRIRAPFSGVIARRYVREGQQIGRGDRLFWITGDGPLRMRFTMPERFIGHVQKGQELPLTTPDVPNQNYQAKIIEVSPVIDPASSTFEVMVELQGHPAGLRPGMDANVSFNSLQ